MTGYLAGTLMCLVAVVIAIFIFKERS